MLMNRKNHYLETKQRTKEMYEKCLDAIDDTNRLVRLKVQFNASTIYDKEQKRENNERSLHRITVT